MLVLRTDSIILLVGILCACVFAQAPLASAVHSTTYGILTVSIESPSTTQTYPPGEIVPVIVVIGFSEGIAMSNTSVLVTSSYDMQFVHVPFLKITEVNQTQAAVYAPPANEQVTQGPLPQIGSLAALNNAGLLQLPYSPGDWSLTLQIEPLTGAYLPYETSFTVHVRAAPRGPPVTLYLLAVGWAITIGFVAFVLRNRFRAKKAATKNTGNVPTQLL